MIILASGQRGTMAVHEFSQPAFFFLLPFFDRSEQPYRWPVEVQFERFASLAAVVDLSVHLRPERHFPSLVVEIELVPLGQSRLRWTTTGEDLKFDDLRWKRSLIGAVD